MVINLLLFRIKHTIKKQIAHSRTFSSRCGGLAPFFGSFLQEDVRIRSTTSNCKICFQLANIQHGNGAAGADEIKFEERDSLNVYVWQSWSGEDCFCTSKVFGNENDFTGVGWMLVFHHLASMILYDRRDKCSSWQFVRNVVKLERVNGCQVDKCYSKDVLLPWKKFG